MLNDDLHILLGAVDLPMVLLGPDLSIRRISAAAEQQLRLTKLDVGRPIHHLRLAAGIPDLEALLTEVQRTSATVEREIQDSQGRWRQLRLLPCKSCENPIEGVVLLLLDIDPLKRDSQRQSERAARAEAVLDAAHNAYLILDAQCVSSKPMRSSIGPSGSRRERSRGSTSCR